MLTSVQFRPYFVSEVVFSLCIVLLFFSFEGNVLVVVRPSRVELRDRKGDQRRVNVSRLKILAIGKIGLVPKYTPNPRVLGTLWSSYGGAPPTQESPRNKQDPTRKQSPKNSARNSMV